MAENPLVLRAQLRPSRCIHTHTLTGNDGLRARAPLLNASVQPQRRTATRREVPLDAAR